jgi:glutathione peroxidase
MSIWDVPLTGLDGSALDPGPFRGRAVLIVNVASKCGLTPQYAGLQALYRRYRDRGFALLGVPCNQYAGQEPGTPEEIASFCEETYAVSFPLTGKLDVNGVRRHPLYEALTRVADAHGRAGDVEWNFEKFLVSAAGEPVARFRPPVQPDAPELVAAIEAALPPAGAPAWVPRTAADVRPGDRVRVPSKGVELTVARIERSFLGRDGLLCLVEDSPARWLAQPLSERAEVEVLVSSTGE